MSGRLKIGDIQINIESMLFNREYLSHSKKLKLNKFESNQFFDHSNSNNSYNFESYKNRSFYQSDSFDNNSFQNNTDIYREEGLEISSEISNILVYSYDLSEFIKLGSIINDNIKGNQRLIKEDIIIELDRKTLHNSYKIKLKIDKNSETFITALGISSDINQEYFVSTEHMSYNLLNINNIEHGRERLPRFYIKFRTTKAGFIKMM